MSIFKNLAKDGITKDWKLYSSYDDPNALFDSGWVQQTLARGSSHHGGLERLRPPLAGHHRLRHHGDAEAPTTTCSS